MLRIDELAEAHGVSRPVIREVVRVLQPMGVLVTRRRVGVTVAEQSAWNVVARGSSAGVSTARAARPSWSP